MEHVRRFDELADLVLETEPMKVPRPAPHVEPETDLVRIMAAILAG